ncbi:cytidine deaminase-like protein [Mariannaea sp. PMI_226]|nr:cytidine deaminase-like protein [Mariannaea sp. PMI_226]
MTSILPGDHKAAMQRALEQAKKSPPKPTNFCVGAIIVRLSDNTIIAEGYTLELPGNTHAEECCLLKLAQQYGVSEEDLPGVIDGPHALYTTVEPCYKRLSGKLPCVQRVLRQNSWISTVYVGVQEPEKFVGQNTGISTIKAAGIDVHHVTGLEEDILKVATAGHTTS